MVKKANEFTEELREHMRGGPGTAKVTNYVTPDDLMNKGRMFAKVVLEPGAGVGWHTHDEDCEICWFTKGKVTCNDNGETKIVEAGDVTVHNHGAGHEVINNFDEPCEFLALVVYA